ncbi:nucleotidyltransferase family protein [Candidatus Kryptonium thompsonii]|nr:nucleotidyltransferase domain-containing protein [Candidatus Kryptonium thompsoni]
MMGKLKLNKKEKQALRELKEKLTEKFPDVDIILFGSKARGDFDPESDIDLLILIEEPINSKIEEEINSIAYEIELKYDVVFGKIIENKNFWNSPLARSMPIHQNIDDEGIKI